MSPLQTQYPLSPKKFWKKYISVAITAIILSLTIGVLISVVMVLVAQGAQNPSLNNIPVALIITSFIVCSLIYFGITLPYSLYVQAYIRRYHYSADDNFITIKKGVFAPAEIHVQYQKIQDVYVDQDILDRIMGLYDVHIASATVSSGIEAHIDGLDGTAAEGIKNLFLDKIRGVGTQAATMNSSAAINSMPQQVPVHLTEDISSRTYPIAGQWVFQGIIGSLFSSAFLAFILSIYTTSSSSNSESSLGSMVSGVLGISSTSIWFILFAIIFAAHVIWIFLWKSTYFFEFLPEYILMRSGILSRSEVHVPYKAVQDVTVKQGIIERLFGLATVTIENAAQAQMVGRRLGKTGITVPGQTLEKANHLAEVMRNVAVTKNANQMGL